MHSTALNVEMLDSFLSAFQPIPLHRSQAVADGYVHCAGSATYQICFRLPIPNPNLNPKINKKQNDTGMKLNIELYLKVDFLGTVAGL